MPASYARLHLRAPSDRAARGGEALPAVRREVTPPAPLEEWQGGRKRKWNDNGKGKGGKGGKGKGQDGKGGKGGKGKAAKGNRDAKDEKGYYKYGIKKYKIDVFPGKLEAMRKKFKEWYGDFTVLNDFGIDEACEYYKAHT